MRPNLSDPAAQPLLQSLRGLLRIANVACSAKPFQFPPPIGELAAEIDELQRFLPPRKRGKPATFWPCVVALDRERPGLHLIVTLEKLYGCIAGITPGPLTKLVQKPDRPPSEMQKVGTLMACLDSNTVPPNVESYLPILTNVASEGYKTALSKAFSSTAYNREEKWFVAYTAFLDVQWHHRAWLRDHLPTVEAAYDLAVVLDHQPFLDRFNSLLFGQHFRPDRILDDRKKMQNRLKTQRLRERVNAAKAAGAKAANPKTRILRRKQLHPK